MTIKPKIRGDILILPFILFLISSLFLGDFLVKIIVANSDIKPDLIPKIGLLLNNLESVLFYLSLFFATLIFMRSYFFSLSIKEDIYNINYTSLKGLNFESNDIDLTSIIDCDLKMNPWNLITFTARLDINSRSEEKVVVERLSYSEAKKIQQKINNLAVNNYSEYRIKRDLRSN